MAKPDAKRSKRKRETEQEIEEDALARSLAAYGALRLHAALL